MFILILLICFIASAAAEETKLDTVRYILPEQTVTGTRRERDWLDNASAITSIRAQDAPAHRAVGLSDDLMLVPGLVAASRFGTDDIRLAIRGMGARANSGVRGVRVLYDGIPESEPDGQTRLAHRREFSESGRQRQRASRRIRVLQIETIGRLGAVARRQRAQCGD
jgi:hypothetical protein